MRVRLAVALALLGVLAGTAAPGVAETPRPPGAAPSAASTANGTAPEIVAAYPNPVAPGDRGEFVVLSTGPGTRLSRYRLSDDDATVSLPNVTVSGRVAVSTAPEATADVGDHPVYAFDGSLALANGGESLRLTRNGTAVDTIGYADAPSGEIRGADRRIRLAGYTLTSQRVGGALIAAAERNVSVRVRSTPVPSAGSLAGRLRCSTDSSPPASPSARSAATTRATPFTTPSTPSSTTARS